MTAQPLHNLASQGKPLPDVCIMKGRLDADGPPVKSVLLETKEFRTKLGNCGAPLRDGFREAADRFRNTADEKTKETIVKMTGISAGQVKDNPDINALDRAVHDKSIAVQGGTVSKGSKVWVPMQNGTVVETTEPSNPAVVVDYDENQMTVSAILDGGGRWHGPTKYVSCRIDNDFVLTSLLIQRLFPSVYKVTDKEEDTEEIKRKPRTKSYNVLSEDRQSNGLHLVAGGEASLKLPVCNPMTGKVPSLFMPVEDVMQSFVSSFSKEESQVGSPSTNLSKFILIDRQSPDDSGHCFFLDQVYESLGKTKLWTWLDKGFFDKDEYNKHFCKHEEISYQELQRRIPLCQKENAQLSEYNDKPGGIDQFRDQEFGFRLLELGIPAGDVTVMEKPEFVAGSKRSIALVDPNHGRDSPLQFGFSILRGHGIDELLMQRGEGANAYIGLAVCGAILTLLGIKGTFFIS